MPLARRSAIAVRGSRFASRDRTAPMPREAPEAPEAPMAREAPEAPMAPMAPMAPIP